MNRGLRAPKSNREIKMQSRLPGTILLFVSFAITSIQAQTYTFSLLSSFSNSGTGPYNPNALIIDSSGNLYGASNDGGKYGVGTLFKVTPNGAVTTLFSFKPSVIDGYSGPSRPNTLARDSKGNLYGTTPYCGCAEGGSPSDPGYVFELKSGKSKLTLLATDWSLASRREGQPPELAVDSVGNVFGMDCTFNDDFIGCGPANLYEVRAGGTYTILHSFPGLHETGIGLDGNLVLRNGNVYGEDDGEVNQPAANGEVWEWSPQSGFSVLHSFDGTDGSYPGSLRQDAAGNLYGSTAGGGINGGGTIFKITGSGVFSTLYKFCSKSNCTDGGYPVDITLDTLGNIYGITAVGGASGFGVPFKVAPSRKESVLYNFTSYPGTNFLMDKSGNFYGTMGFSTTGPNGVWKLTKR
jgi:uncharacterized repeat protein (TIGR03803 family)